MKPRLRFYVALGVVVAAFIVWLFSGGRDSGDSREVSTFGRFEVTAKLVEIPGRLPDPEQFDYTYVLKYEVQEVHRGEIAAKEIFVGHFNPPDPRYMAANKKISGIGGNLREFVSGHSHRMALDLPLEEFSAGIPLINEYGEKTKGPIYWAVWTNKVD
ncbi:MAG: hypothetical protein QF437_02310 [Planctomycetota bacterium]|nr:hypothetical protein [Planctomycetota bacterium]MDP7129287.1 hypothetical protein [Planctomycetota bacterium]MDP7251336.1 hypothetical protein [Planctomycetota bacterium]